ncbi:MAG: GNAT family N-acetyltransferase [Gemmataceae bacterium]
MPVPPIPDTDLYYLCQPKSLTFQPPADIGWHSTAEFLAHEPDVKKLWELISTQFRTRSKFLTVWPSVRYVATHHNAARELDGFLLVTAPVNWQIDYVVVDAASRGQGIASRLVQRAVLAAQAQAVPYIMLTSRPGLRPLYEACGFQVVAEKQS